MRGGHNAKPNQELAANGTYRKDRHAARLEAPPAEGIPEPPAHFDAEHRQRWYKVGGMLKTLGILADVDAESLRTYVAMAVTADRAYIRYLEKAERCDWLIFRDASTMAERLQDKFGFTPRARMGIKVPEQPKTSPILEMMKGRVKKPI